MKLPTVITRPLLPILLALPALLFAPFVAAQVLVNGNSLLPACATSCTLLQQAAQACGGVSTADQAIWSCFCQSGYLKTLYTSPNGICDSSCPSASDQQQVMTWYKSNCGTDDGASEHADSGSTSSSIGAGAVATSGGASLPSTTASGGITTTVNNLTSGGRWWHSHYKWVIMVIVIFVGLVVLAIVGIVLKHRHDRKADQIRGGFNEGITTRSAPMTAVGGVGNMAPESSHIDHTQMTTAGPSEAPSGRDSPVRTREAFMPYGYAYTRSESRLASRTDVAGRSSPLARGGTPIADQEKDAGIGSLTAVTPGTDPTKRSRRVLVRERSLGGSETPDAEKHLP